jgi:ankyrin repeat protein
MHAPRSNCLLIVVSITAGMLCAADDLRLVNAVQVQDTTSIKTLLSQHIDVNAMQPDGMTALIWAAHNDDIDTVTALIKAGANVKLTNKDGIPALYEAAVNGDPAMVELLLKAGADANTTVSDGQTMLMTASRTGNVAVVKMLLDHGAKVNAIEGWHGENALIWAAAENHAAVVKLLIERGADPNANATHLIYPPMKKLAGDVFSPYPPGGLTPLMEAARQNALEAAQALVEGGAKVDDRDPENASAMVIAAANTHWDLANYLLEHGADPNDGSIWMAAEERDSVQTIHASSNHEETLTSLDFIKNLLAKGAKTDSLLTKALTAKKALGGNTVAPIDATALWRAARSADLELMQLLLDHGADVNKASRNDSTPLMSAAQAGSLGGGAGNRDEHSATDADLIKAIRLCMEYGGDVNAADSTGMTPLLLAASKGSDQIVQYLATHGARLDAKDKRGRTAIEVALNKGGPALDANGHSLVHENTAALLRKLQGLPAEDAKTGEKPAMEKSNADDRKSAEPKEVAGK